MQNTGGSDCFGHRESQDMKEAAAGVAPYSQERGHQLFFWVASSHFSHLAAGPQAGIVWNDPRKKG